jgi:hypothetical protein
MAPCGGWQRELWGRVPPPLFEQGRQPVIPFRKLDADRSLWMLLG